MPRSAAAAVNSCDAWSKPSSGRDPSSLPPAKCFRVLRVPHGFARRSRRHVTKTSGNHAARRARCPATCVSIDTHAKHAAAPVQSPARHRRAAARVLPAAARRACIDRFAAQGRRRCVPISVSTGGNMPSGCRQTADVDRVRHVADVRQARRQARVTPPHPGQVIDPIDEPRASELAQHIGQPVDDRVDVGQCVHRALHPPRRGGLDFPSKFVACRLL